MSAGDPNRLTIQGEFTDSRPVWSVLINLIHSYSRSSRRGQEREGPPRILTQPTMVSH